MFAFVSDVKSIPIHNTGLRLIELIALLAIGVAAAFLTWEAKVLNPKAFWLLTVAGGVTALGGVMVKPHTSDAYAHPLTCLGILLWALAAWLHTKSKMYFGLVLAFLVVVGVLFANR